MTAYSLDLRQRVVAAVERGESTIAKVAELFSVGSTFIKKMLRMHRQGADLAPKPHGGGHTPRLDEKPLAKLKAHLKAHNDLTLNELREHLAAAEQIQVSRATVGRAGEQSDQTCYRIGRARLVYTLWLQSRTRMRPAIGAGERHRRLVVVAI